MPLKAIAINCSLKHASDEPSSTDAMIRLLGAELGKHDVMLTDTIRIVDRNILPGVTSDEGEGDAWPAIRRTILEHDILIFGTPVWLGQMSSLAKLVLERMDAFLSETDERGRMPSYGKVAVAAIVGNEDGAHAITASLFHALNDVGWTIPAGASSYWVGEALQKTDFKDLPKVPDAVQQGAVMLAANAAHLAKLLQQHAYPGVEQAK